MQDLSDNLLNLRITSALREETAITPRQKQLAWERLRERATQQSALVAPTTAFSSAPAPTPRERLLQYARRLMPAIRALLFDETRYARAMHYRRTRHPYSMLQAPLRTLCSGVGT